MCTRMRPRDDAPLSRRGKGKGGWQVRVHNLNRCATGKNAGVEWTRASSDHGLSNFDLFALYMRIGDEARR